MIYIYKVELYEIDIKLKVNKVIKVKECRNASFGLYQF